MIDQGWNGGVGIRRAAGRSGGGPTRPGRRPRWYYGAIRVRERIQSTGAGRSGKNEVSGWGFGWAELSESDVAGVRTPPDLTWVWYRFAEFRTFGPSRTILVIDRVSWLCCHHAVEVRTWHILEKQQAKT